jgi:hypothetical protein
MKGVELAAHLFKSKTATRRIVSRMIAAGLVVEDGGAFDLAPGWSERVTELDAIVPTAGTIARRGLVAEDNRILHCNTALEKATDPAEIESLTRRLGKAKGRKWELIQPDVLAYNERAAALGLPGVNPEIALEPASGENYFAWRERQAMELMPLPTASRAAYENRRAMEIESQRRRAGHIFADAKPFGGFLWREQLAELRSIAGRIGVDLTQNVERIALEWG